jgi:ribosomal protein S12 methylthiotransferase accessory factor
MGCFGTNGKGRTEDYALASCYAELVERLQNGMVPMLSRTMLSHLHERHGFFYHPLERYLFEAELRRLPAEIRADLMYGRVDNGKADDFISVYTRRLRANGLPGAVSLPFYDTMHQRVVELPRDLLLWAVGSNGMAAGNTIGEALFQALCEVLERWGAAEVFFRSLTPPSVPEEFLQMFPDEHGVISRIRDDTGYRLVVKDFSGGLGIPVLGVVVIDASGGKYRLAVGSDTLFPDALSRCITEIYQGCSGSSGFAEKLLNVPEQNPWFFQEDTDSARRARWEEFSSFTKDGTGRFPPSLFGIGADYAFDPSIFDSRDTHEAEVRRLITFFHASGHNVYLHDCSFLGFPSVLVYIPGLSSLRSRYAEERQWRRLLSSVPVDEVQPLMLRLDTCSTSELLRILEVLKECPPTWRIADLLQLTFDERASWHEVNVAFLHALIRYRLGQFREASSAFEAFLSSTPQPRPFHRAIATYLQLRSSGSNTEETERELQESFDDFDLAQRVCEELRTGGSVFHLIGFPACPNCSDCRIRGDCLTRGVVRLADKLSSLMKEGMPDQRSLAGLVE